MTIQPNPDQSFNPSPFSPTVFPNEINSQNDINNSSNENNSSLS